MPYEDEVMLRGVVLLMCLRFPRATAIHLQRYWYLNVVTREYTEPSYAQLQAWVKEVRAI